MALRKEKKDWTLILIADNGPAGSFQIRRRSFRILVLLLLGVLAVGGVSLYFNEVEHVMLREHLSGKLEKTEKAFTQATSLNRDLTQKIGEIEDSLVASLDDSGGSGAFLEPSGVDISDSNLSIDNFEVRRDPADTAIRFKFLLRNLDESVVSSSGFIFVVYRPHYLDTSTWMSFPPVSLESGMPDDFTRGDFFNIARFKTVRGHFTDVSLVRPYFVSVWVFSGDGDLLLFRDFFIQE